MATLCLTPFGVVFEQLQILAIETARRPNIEGELADLPNGTDARQRKEEAEVIGKILEGARNGVTTGQVFGLEVGAVRSKDEFRLSFGRGRAGLQRLQGLRNLAARAGDDVDVAGLKHTAEIGLVRGTRAQALDRRLFVPKGFEEGVREARGIERLLREVGYGLLNLNCVQVFALCAVNL